MRTKQIFLSCCLGVAALSNCYAANTTTIKIISFNDFHGNLESAGNFGLQAGGPGTPIIETAAGGVDSLAAYVASLKAENPNNILVSAGDLLGASPLISALYHDEPTIEAMNQLGLALNGVGNHEFDKGQQELQRMQNGGCHPKDVNSCKGLNGKFTGAKFKFLAANVIDKHSRQPIFPAYAIKTFKTGKTKIQIAFIGLTLKDTPQIVNPAGINGLSFKGEGETINALLPRLRALGVKAIVVLLHQGSNEEAAAGSFINDCPISAQNSLKSPVKTIVSQLDDAVDLVISGHSHSGYICLLPNKLGRDIPVTQANSFGRVLTDIDLTFDNKTGKVENIAARNITIDRNNPAYAADSKINAIVAHYAKLIRPLANKPVGTIASAINSKADSNGEMETGDLIADAQLQASKLAASGHAEIALINPGGIRGLGFHAVDGVYPHTISYAEAFSILPYGNTLVTISLTAQQIKDALEEQFVGNGCLLAEGVNQQTAQRILQVSKGFHVEWDASVRACSKIRKATLVRAKTASGELLVDEIVNEGRVLHPEQSYRVTVNDYLIAGGDNFNTFRKGIDLQAGVFDITALTAYLQVYLPPNTAYNPADDLLSKPRLLKTGN